MAKSKNRRWGPPRNCKELIAGCRAFLSKEPRDVVYGCALQLARSSDPEKTADGILLLLSSWNSVYFRYKGIYTDELIRKIKFLMKRTLATLQRLNGKTLENITTDNLDIIESLFDYLREKEALKITGASKFLHILNPRLFVMWDYDIRNNYHGSFHKKSRKKSNHACGSGKCYSMFLKQMQECAVNLIKEKPKNEICRECSNPFFTIDLPKALDQHNYAKAKLDPK